MGKKLIILFLLSIMENSQSDNANEYLQAAKFFRIEHPSLKHLAIAFESLNKFIGENKEYKDFETDLDVVIPYEKMSDSQKLDFLRCENPVEDDTKVKIEVFGGENVVEVLKAVRGLSDEDFNALIAK